jgi:hypothetical protein
MHWTATAKAALPVLKGTPRPMQELRQLLSKSRLNGAHPALLLEEFPQDDMPGTALRESLSPHSQPAGVSDEQQVGAATFAASEPIVPIPSTDPGEIRGKNRGKKKQKQHFTQGATEHGSGAILHEEWPAAYRADVLKHIQRIWRTLDV